MNKLLIGLLGLAGLFLAFSLVLHLKTPKPMKSSAPQDAARPMDSVQVPDAPQAALRPEYGSPEEIIADYRNAMSFTTSTETLNTALTDYSLCQAYREESPKRCEQLDALIQSTLKFDACVPLFNYAMMAKDFIGGSGNIEHCMANQAFRDAQEMHRYGEDHHDDSDMNEKFCKGAAPHWAKGNLEAFCRFKGKALALDDDPPAMAYKRCMAEDRDVSGDPSKCQDVGGGFNAFCAQHAKLSQALRTNNVKLVAGTPYEPLVNPKADCGALAKKVMAIYDDRANQFTRLQIETVHIRRFEEKEKQRSEKEKNAQELEAQAAKAKADAAARALELKRAQEDAQRLKEIEEKRKKEIQEKYEEARIADEQKRLQKRLPMRKTKEKPRSAVPDAGTP